jgi:outer membrane biosynthesis protein TonB
VRWDSPPVLVVVGTLSIHALLLTAGDAIATYNRFPPEPAPALELFDIETPPPPPEKAEPHPLPLPLPLPQPLPLPLPQPKAVSRQPQPSAVSLPPQPETPQPQPAHDGGAPILKIADLAPSAIGVGVGKGPTTTGHIGRGGSGSRAGSGSGTGSESGSGSAPVPMSIATIKTRALPHGDYSYFGAGNDYPAEAKSLAVEGTIRTRLVVSAQGKVSAATPLNKLGHGLDELADRYAHAIEFDAARDTNDQPVASVVVWTFQFTLPH